jgi:hypothetical protein
LSYDYADNESRRTVLKTVAAFGSGFLFGVSDNGTVSGLDPTTIERQRDRLVSMIRDLVTLGPLHDIRHAEINDRQTLALEVRSGSAGGYGLFPENPELYVRRGATKFRARFNDIAAAINRG